MILQARSKASGSSSNDQFKTLGSQKATLQGLIAADLVQPFITATGSSYGFRAIEIDQMNIPFSLDLVVGMWLTGALVNVKTMWQADVIKNVTISYFCAMAAQILNLGLSQPQETTVHSQATVNGNTVLVSELPPHLSRIRDSPAVLDDLCCVAYYIRSMEPDLSLFHRSNFSE
jgi:hypothetical protein